MSSGDLTSAFAAAPSPALSATALAPLANESWLLELPWRHQRAGVLRYEAALQIDSLLVRIARGSGALELAMGEALASLAVGDRVLRLGYSGIGDYARERLGIAGRTAQAMARLARELRDRPLLRELVRRGEVSARKAQAVLPVARGDDELQWVERARTETVRALEADVRAAKTVGDPENDEDWERICVPLAPEGRAKLDEAMELAGKLLGATAPKWQRLEVICQEFMGAHPVAEPNDNEVGENSAASGVPAAGGAAADSSLEASREGLRLPPGSGREGARPPPVSDSATARSSPLESLEQFFETETSCWAVLDKASPVAVPDGREEGDDDPLQLDEDLRRLGGMRNRWDELVGHLGMLMRTLGLWRELHFASFSHYCTERLGMAPRTVEQRVWLERRFYELPELRRAMRAGRISYEKARLVAGCADQATVNSWIEKAKKTTCIALTREIESREETQMCALGELDLRVPRRVAVLLEEAFRAAREAEGRWLSPGACLERVAQHFIEVWNETLRERSTPQRRVLLRDHGYCQVPGCSQAAVHAHHVLYRSLGGGNQGENLVGLCAAHHLHCVHRGWVRVRGRAPDELIWELGVRPGREPLVAVPLVVLCIPNSLE